jgi:hypothetical protein
MQTDESRELIHTLMLNPSGLQGEARRLRRRSNYGRQTDELFCDRCETRSVIVACICMENLDIFDAVRVKQFSSPDLPR